MAKQKAAGNPAIIRPLKGRSPEGHIVAIGRMGIGVVGDMQHLITVALMNEDTEEPIGAVVVDEADFIDKLGRLFPRGELDGANMEEGPEDREALERELDALIDLTLDKSNFPAESYYHKAMARLHQIKEIMDKIDEGLADYREGG
jgi:hypothetical protein